MAKSSFALLHPDAERVAKVLQVHARRQRRRDLPKTHAKRILHGSGEDEIKFFLRRRRVRHTTQETVSTRSITNINRRYPETESEWERPGVAENISPDVHCESRHGIVKPEADVRSRSAASNWRNLGVVGDVCAGAGEWFETVTKAINAQQTRFAPGAEGQSRAVCRSARLFG